MALIAHAYLDILRDEESLPDSPSASPACFIRVLPWKVSGADSEVLANTFCFLDFSNFTPLCSFLPSLFSVLSFLLGYCENPAVRRHLCEDSGTLLLL